MEILKLFFDRREDGVWQIASMKPMSLDPDGQATDLYSIRDDVFLADPPFGGTIKSMLAQSIVPVVAVDPKEHLLKCLGTGFFVSCTGLLITAAHVITDPIDRNYGGAKELENGAWHTPDIELGVLVVNNPLFQAPGYKFFPIEWAMFLANRTESPLPIGGIELKLNADSAICKVQQLAPDIPHQPLAIVQNGLAGTGIAVGKTATAIGYAGMQNIPLDPSNNDRMIEKPEFDLHVSTGKIIEHIPDNAISKSATSPGPCFSASMKFPPGMSGSPIFDDERIYVHGVVSKGWEGSDGLEALGYGSMLAPSLQVPLKTFDQRSLLALMEDQSHGIPRLSVPGA